VIKPAQCLHPSFCFCHSTRLLSFVLAALKDVDQPLQLVSRIRGVHHQPEVLSRTKVHVERDHPQTGLDLQRVEASVSGVTAREIDALERLISALGHTIKIGNTILGNEISDCEKWDVKLQPKKKKKVKQMTKKNTSLCRIYKVA